MLDRAWDLGDRPLRGTLLHPDRPRCEVATRRGRSVGQPSCWRRLHR